MMQTSATAEAGTTVSTLPCKCCGRPTTPREPTYTDVNGNAVIVRWHDCAFCGLGTPTGEIPLHLASRVSSGNQALRFPVAAAIWAEEHRHHAVLAPVAEFVQNDQATQNRYLAMADAALRAIGVPA